MSDPELHLYINDYKCQNDEDIQWETSCRYEFYSLRSKEKVQEKYNKYFYHQEIFLRYLRQYQNIFNIQGTGTGKSGNFINAAEFYKKHNEGIKRVYVLEPGPPTVKDFKRQILNFSDPNDYTSLRLKTAKTLRSKRNNISRLINEWYSVKTYQQFGGKKLSDNDIIEKYSDCIIIMDEAHILRNQEDNSLSKEDKLKVYQFLWRVTHLAKRSKFVISTATPMINNTIEFAYLLNLLLPEDFQMPINVSDNFYDKVTLSQFEPFLRGKMTFIKFLDKNINVINKGKILNNYKHLIEMPKSNLIKGEPLLPMKRKIKNSSIIDIENPKEKKQPIVETSFKKYSSQTKIVMLPMKTIQLETYLKTLKDSTNFYSSQRQSSTFVFPNGKYGQDGFNTYIKKDDLGNYIFKNIIRERNKENKIIEINSLEDYFDNDNIKASLDNLSNMSSKFRFYIEKEINSKGNSFIYTEAVQGGGAILLGLIFKKFGFEEYKSTNDPFNIRTGKLEGITKKRRFVLLTAKSNNTDVAIKLFNSKENMNGEYIQCIIASQTVSVGISLFNVKRGYILTPVWHESGMHQALSRFIRADSHDMLFDKIGKKIDVEVYRLAATRENEEELLYSKGIENATIDIKNYIRSEKKNIKIKRPFRIFKQTAFDAYLNYDRNTSSDIIPYTSESDYDIKNYKIWKARGLPNNDKRIGIAKNQGPSNDDIIWNTYNLLYSDEIICNIKKIIIKILKKKQYINLDNIDEELKNDMNNNYSDYTLQQAIYQLVYNNEIITNNQNIQQFYIRLRGNILYIKKERIIKNNLISNENNIFFIKNFPELEKKIVIKNEENFLLKKQKLLSISKEGKDIDSIKKYYIMTQDFNFFKFLLEESLINHHNGKQNYFDEVIFKLFENYIIIMKEPISYINEAKITLKQSSKGQGRRRTEESKAGFKNFTLKDKKLEYNDNIIYAHFYKESEDTNFAITSILENEDRDIKILKNNEFINANLAENYVYNYFFNKKYEMLLKRFKKNKYYGSYILRGGKDDKFYEDKIKNFFRIINNENPKNKGIICKSITPINRMKKILKDIDIENEYSQYYDVKVKKNNMCNIIFKILKKYNLIFESF